MNIILTTEILPPKSDLDNLFSKLPIKHMVIFSKKIGIYPQEFRPIYFVEKDISPIEGLYRAKGYIDTAKDTFLFTPYISQPSVHTFILNSQTNKFGATVLLKKEEKEEKYLMASLCKYGAMGIEKFFTGKEDDAYIVPGCYRFGPEVWTYLKENNIPKIKNLLDLYLKQSDINYYFDNNYSLMKPPQFQEFYY